MITLSSAVQAVVGSIVWAFRRLKKPRCREMSAPGYALYTVCPQISFLNNQLNWRKRYSTPEIGTRISLFWVLFYQHSCFFPVDFRFFSRLPFLQSSSFFQSSSVSHSSSRLFFSVEFRFFQSNLPLAHRGYRPCLLAVTADNHLIRYDFDTGVELQRVFLHKKYQFRWELRVSFRRICFFPFFRRATFAKTNSQRKIRFSKNASVLKKWTSEICLS